MAMKRFFETYPKSRIQVSLVIYHRLNEDKERDVYRKWNIPIKQSTDDFINSYKESIPMFERLKTDLPCSIYGSPSKMRLRDIINSHIAVNENPYRGGEKKTTYDFVKYMQGLKNKDVDIMLVNFNILQEIFNPDKIKDFSKLSPFKNIVFRAIYYLVGNNIKPLGKEYVIKRMRRILAYRDILDRYRRFYGRRASVDAYLAFKSLLNDCKPDKWFV